MSSAARAIERYFSQRYGREALYLPSGRLALRIRSTDPNNDSSFAWEAGGSSNSLDAPQLHLGRC